jgi:hypothetical protein
MSIAKPDFTISRKLFEKRPQTTKANAFGLYKDSTL